MTGGIIEVEASEVFSSQQGTDINKNEQEDKMSVGRQMYQATWSVEIKRAIEDVYLSFLSCT